MKRGGGTRGSRDCSAAGTCEDWGAQWAHPPSDSRQGMPGATQLTVKFPCVQAPSKAMSRPMPLIGTLMIGTFTTSEGESRKNLYDD